jgi:hypothetical protein
VEVPSQGESAEDGSLPHKQENFVLTFAYHQAVTLTLNVLLSQTKKKPQDPK